MEHTKNISLGIKVKDASLTTLTNYFWRYHHERCLAAGIPPSFLAILVHENRFDDAELEKFLDRELSAGCDDLVEILMPWAKDVGVYECDACCRYYTLVDAVIVGDRDGVPFCPQCGLEIRPTCCAVCADNLYTSKRFVGTPIRGYYLCPCCFAEVERPVSKILAAR